MVRASERLDAARQEKRLAPARIFMALLLVLVLLVTGFMFIKSSFFAVGTVVVEGNKYISNEDIYRIAGIPDKVNIFWLDTGEIRSRLTRDLRVAEAKVTRQVPTTIIIHIVERKPLAYLANAYGFVQVDSQGVVLSVFKNLRQVNVPIITGIRLGNVYVGDKVENYHVKSILAYLAALDEATLNRLSEINIKSDNELIVYTVQSMQIRLGNSERLTEKAKLTRDILQELSDKKMAVEYVDLTFASPYIKFRP